MRNGEWGMGNGKWEMENEEWGMGNIGNGTLENVKRRKGNGK